MRFRSLARPPDFFPSLVTSLHRLAIHFGPLFVVAYVVTRLLPYLRLQSVQFEEAFSWTLSADPEAALPPHMFLMLPFLSCIVVLCLGYAQALGLACLTPLMYARYLFSTRPPLTSYTFVRVMMLAEPSWPRYMAGRWSGVRSCC